MERIQALESELRTWKLAYKRQVEHADMLRELLTELDPNWGTEVKRLGR